MRRRLITCCLLLFVIEASAELLSTNDWPKEDLLADRETNAHHFQRYVSKRQFSIADDSSTNLRIMTFNARNYSSVGERDVPLAKVISTADLIVVQEVRSADAAQTLLVELQKVSSAYRLEVSDPLPSDNDTLPELHTYFYRSDRLNVVRSYDAPADTFSTGDDQARPPFVVEFEYMEGDTKFKFMVVPVHAATDITAREEINYASTVALHLMYLPTCFSENVIVLGNFNQVPKYVGQNWHSDMQQSSTFLELHYEGSSTVLANDTDNRVDRVFVHGRFTDAIDVFNETTIERARVLRNYDPSPLATVEDVSDHYPIYFDVDITRMQDQSKGQCTSIGSVVTQLEQMEGGPPVDASDMHLQPNSAFDCQVCSTQPPEGGVFPAGTGENGSVATLGLDIPPVVRGDSTFFRLFQFGGDFFIFQNQERLANWCGSPEQECFDCRGVTEVSIGEQCADRIMCPVLAKQLLILNLRLQACYADRTIIIQQAFSEPDSQYPDSRSSNSSLHRNALEAELSVSVPVKGIIDQRDFDSDGNFTDVLASLAVCVGFDYIKINHNTVSVAMKECFNDSISVPICEELPLANGMYAGQHDGPVYQQGEAITAICDPGYLLNGTTERQCIADGVWSGMDSTCDQDVDECQINGTCPEHSTCANTLGSFVCTCNEGFVKNGSVCIVNECLIDGVTYTPGQNVPNADPCKTCQCSPLNDEQQICSVEICNQFNPCAPGEELMSVPEQCCPVCTPHCVINNVSYVVGDNIPNGHPCNSCVCDPSSADQQSCIDLMDDCIPCAPIEREIFLPDTCCPVCILKSQCLIDGVLYTEGQNIPNDDPCTTCQCFPEGSGPQQLCSVAACALLPCLPGEEVMTFPDQCCPVCVPITECVIDGVTYNIGDNIPSDDLCSPCVCDPSSADQQTCTSPCDQNAVCTNTPGSFTCACKDGYRGDGLTCADIDECVEQSPCDENAVCTNSNGSFVCVCNDGYQGDGLTCTDVNECLATPCDGNAVCTNTQGSFTCVCNNGYRGDGMTCIDIDECVEQSPCDENAVCTNTPGSFTCACNEGYRGDGLTCTDVNECLTTPCGANAVCTNTLGSFTCVCNPGYSGDGLTCNDINECVEQSPCDQNAQCTNSIGSFTCACNNGYRGDGLTCTDIDECQEQSPCGENAVCTNTPGSFTCACSEGYSGDGLICTDIVECEVAFPCDDNAKCVNTPGSFSCTCNEGYSGDGFTCTDIECEISGVTYAIGDPIDFGDPCISCFCHPQPRGQQLRCTVTFCNPLTCASGERLTRASDECCSVCVPILCPEPESTPNGNYQYLNSATTPVVGSQLEYTCQSTHTLVGERVLTCLNTGNWSSDAPTCADKLCPDPVTPRNGNFQYLTSPSSPIVGSRVEYSCEASHRLVGSATITCLAGGQWSANTPTCQEILCPEPVAPANGNFKYLSSSSIPNVGSGVEFSCNSTYRLVGSSVVTCLTSGEWSANMPICEEILCPEPNAPRNGAFTYLTSPATPRVGSRVQYSCTNNPPFYRLVGTSTVTCLATGEWSASTPSCRLTFSWFG